MTYGEAEYIRDHYGTCVGVLDCQCQRNIAQGKAHPVWGREWRQDDKHDCPRWRRLPERSWDAIVERLRRSPGAWVPS